MAQSNPPLLERDALASLNQLRDGPAAVRLASHLLMTLAGRLPDNLGEALRRRQWQRERGDISDTERRACLDC